MSGYEVGYFVGSLSSTSINRVLASALIRLAPGDLEFTEIGINTLPLYSPDYDEHFPPEATALKQAIAHSDAVLFVTPEYNRSIPGALKNAIDWASRPWGRNSSTTSPPASSAHRRSDRHCGGATEPARGAQLLQRPADDFTGGLHPLLPGSVRRRWRGGQRGDRGLPAHVHGRVPRLRGAGPDRDPPRSGRALGLINRLRTADGSSSSAGPDEVFVHESHGDGTLTDGGRHSLHRATAHVPDCEDPGRPVSNMAPRPEPVSTNPLSSSAIAPLSQWVCGSDPIRTKRAVALEIAGSSVLRSWTMTSARPRSPRSSLTVEVSVSSARGDDALEAVRQGKANVAVVWNRSHAQRDLAGAALGSVVFGVALPLEHAYCESDQRAGRRARRRGAAHVSPVTVLRDLGPHGRSRVPRGRRPGPGRRPARPHQRPGSVATRRRRRCGRRRVHPWDRRPPGDGEHRRSASRSAATVGCGGGLGDHRPTLPSTVS